MPVVDFEMLTGEVAESEELMVYQALARSSLLHGADNKPVIFVMSDKVVYIGGSVATQGRFTRIPRNSILVIRTMGLLRWECLELTHLDIEGEKKIYLCPFTGSPELPVKDMSSLDNILSKLR